MHQNRNMIHDFLKDNLFFIHDSRQLSLIDAYTLQLKSEFI